MQILVTGALGVNGAPVLRQFIAKGFRPTIVDLNPDFSLAPEAKSGADFVKGDFTDTALVDGILAGKPFDAIVHMAAIVGNAQDEPLETFRVNAHGTVQLLELARKHKVRRFVFTSSRAVYGAIEGVNAYPTYKPVSEDDPLRPVRVYDVCKVAAEGMGRHYADHFGIEFVALRFSTIFGPGKGLRHRNYGIVSRIFEDGLRGRPVEIEKGGDEKDDMIYVDDAAEAIVTATLHPTPGHGAYNVSSGKGVTLGDIAATVKQLRPDAQIRIGGGLNYMGWHINYAAVLDNSRIAKDLGFKPRYDLLSAARAYKEWLDRNPG